MNPTENYVNDVSNLLCHVSQPPEDPCIIFVSRGKICIGLMSHPVNPQNKIFKCSIAVLTDGPTGLQWDAIRNRITQAIEKGLLP